MAESRARGNIGLTSRLSPEFGDWLRRTRMGMPMTIEEFAAKAHLNRSTVAALELSQGKTERAITVGLFERLADALNMELGFVLHKAGFDIGRDGIDLLRLKRVETLAGAFMGQERTLRHALSWAMEALDRPGEIGAEPLIVELGRALAAVDRVSEVLRREKFIAAPLEYGDVTSLPWTDEERRFLDANPHLSHEDAGEQLGRSSEAVRHYRKRNREGATV